MRALPAAALGCAWLLSLRLRVHPPSASAGHWPYPCMGQGSQPCFHPGGDHWHCPLHWSLSCCSHRGRRGACWGWGQGQWELGWSLQELRWGTAMGGAWVAGELCPALSPLLLCKSRRRCSVFPPLGLALKPLPRSWSQVLPKQPLQSACVARSHSLLWWSAVVHPAAGACVGAGQEGAWSHGSRLDPSEAVMLPLVITERDLGTAGSNGAGDAAQLGPIVLCPWRGAKER